MKTMMLNAEREFIKSMMKEKKKTKNKILDCLKPFEEDACLASAGKPFHGFARR